MNRYIVNLIDVLIRQIYSYELFTVGLLLRGQSGSSSQSPRGQCLDQLGKLSTRAEFKLIVTDKKNHEPIVCPKRKM